jgi:transcriptional regulator with XRE-family HTH domain
MVNAKIQLGKNLKEIRLQAGLSQEQIADISSLHRTYIGSVERGERNISLENIVLIAKALKISPSKLLEGVE